MKTGFLLIDKPEGPTSHDIVDQLRKILDLRRIGHAGTLDPFASGLLLVGIGKATRLLEYLGKEDKTYSFELILGSTTDTYDRTGTIQPYADSLSPGRVEATSIQNILKEFIGEGKQTPPPFSAIKYKGKRLYQYAREGKKIDVQPRNVVIHSFKLLSYDYPRVLLEARVSKGTYIRSLGHDMGKRLGTGAYVQNLRRTAIGSLDVRDAVSIENIIEKDGMSKGWLLIGEALKDWARYTVSGEGAKRLLQGNAIPETDVTPQDAPRSDRPFLIQDGVGRVLCAAVFQNLGNRSLIQPRKILI